MGGTFHPSLSAHRGARKAAVMSAAERAKDPFLQERFDTEAGLLGAILGSGDAVSYRAAAAIAGPEHFSDSFNARLFSLLGRGFDLGLYAFPLTAWLIAQLRDADTLKEVGTTGSRIIARYIAEACPGIAVEGSARQIRHDSLVIVLKQAVEDGDTAAAETCAAEMERLSRAHLERDTTVESIATVSKGVIERLNDAYMNGAPPPDFAFPGSHDLARVITGWRRGRFYVIAGRPGMGKTTTGLSWLLRTASKGHGVMFFSLEMGAAELSEIALADLAWAPSRRIEYRDIAASQVTSEGFASRLETILQVEPLMRSLPFLIVDKPGLNIAQIRSMAMQHKQRLEAQGKTLEVVCIDHLNLIAPADSYRGNKSAETEEISMSLKRLAKELDIAVISLVQLNRAVEGREDKRPGLSDLRWSGAIEQDADVVMFLYREAYYLERRKHDVMDQEDERQLKLQGVKNRLEVSLAKHRGGPCPVLEFYCDLGCGAVRDMDHRDG